MPLAAGAQLGPNEIGSAIVHRDPKPADVNVNDDGAEFSQSSTLTRPGTAVGVILGTVAYWFRELERIAPRYG